MRRVDPDVVHGHSSIGGLLARVAARGHRSAVAYTPNGVTDVAGRGRRGAGAGPRHRSRGRGVRQRGGGGRRRRVGPPDRVVTIPNGIDLAPAAPIDLRALLGLATDVPLVGTIARLVPQKAPLDLVAAAAAVHARRPDVRFVLVGDGALADAVDAAIEAAGLAGVLHRIPVLEGAAGALGALEVFLLTSRFEGGPYAPLEAMRAGTAGGPHRTWWGAATPWNRGSRASSCPSGTRRRPQRPWWGSSRTPSWRAELVRRALERLAERFDVAAMGARHDALYADLARTGTTRKKRSPS